VAYAITTVQIHFLAQSWRIKMGQWGCKGGQCLVRCHKNPQIVTQSGGHTSSKEKWGTKRAGNLLRAKTLYFLPTKWRHGVFPYVPEEGHPVLSWAKGPWVIVQKWEGGRKSLAAREIQTCLCGSRVVLYKPQDRVSMLHSKKGCSGFCQKP
jgi:hypothetical protein